MTSSYDLRPQNGKVVEISIASFFILVLVALTVSHYQRPRSSPAAASTEFVDACARADLGALRKATAAATVDAFVRHFGAKRRVQALEVYERAARLGRDRWRQYRERSNTLAVAEYQRLRDRVSALGRQAVNELPVDARMRLMDSPSAYQAALLERGIAALPAQERASAQNLVALRSGSASPDEVFLEQEGYRLLPPEDRAVVPSAAALSNGRNAEKDRLLETLGLPLLSEEERKRITGFTRAELLDTEAFDLKHGAEPAQQFLQALQMGKRTTSSNEPLCTFRKVEEQGSLFRGDEATCSPLVDLGGQSRRQALLRLSLREAGSEWLVQGIEPALPNL